MRVLAEIVVVLSDQRTDSAGFLAVQSDHGIQQTGIAHPLGDGFNGELTGFGEYKAVEVDVAAFRAVECLAVNHIGVTRKVGLSGRGLYCGAFKTAHDGQFRQVVGVAQSQQVADFMHGGGEPRAGI